MFILTYSLKLIAESAGIEPNTVSRTKQLSRLSLSPSRFTLLKNFLYRRGNRTRTCAPCGPVPKTGRKPTTGYTPILSQNLELLTRKKITDKSSQSIGSTNYFIKIVPKIDSNYYLPPCRRVCAITPLGNVVNYSTKIKPLLIP